MPRSAILDERRLAEAVPARAVETVDDVLDEMHRRITQRAFELFETHGLCGCRELDDWLSAERELCWQPPVSIVERDGTVIVEMAMPGLKPDDVDVQMTDHRILVRSECGRPRAGETEQIHVDELPRGQVFRCIELSSTLEPAAARATLRDGMLKIEVPVAEAKTQPAASIPVEGSEQRLRA
ncbi:MAG TPA: Hsp20/alpha crystallin family protein [Gammaproteobacteria bacterium]|nr:Hsp20/alpha crystallin family protein [Gammaproteobacteria bacterium]